MKIVLSDPKGKKAYNIELDEAKAAQLIGHRLGETLSGKELGLSGYEIKLTGGSDKDGVPMRKDVHGTGRARPLLTGGQGYRQRDEGVVKRRLVRGNVITGDVVQVNAVVVKGGKEALETLLSSA